MAGKVNKGNKRLKDYGKVLMAKQLLRAIYNNPRERLFKKFFGKKMEVKFSNKPNLIAEPKTTTPTINKVFTGLSSRLEIILTAMGGALSYPHARQLISHGKVSVNGYTVKQRNYLLKDGDIIVSKAGLSFSEIATGGNAHPISQSANLASSSASSGKGYNRAPNYFEEREKRQALFQLEKKVGGMKTEKLPGFLKIKTPVAASLLINPELNLGIYYSKSLFSRGTENKLNDSTATLAATGWKNMSVKELKLLLAPADSLSSAYSKGGPRFAQRKVAFSPDKLAPQQGCLSLAKQEQVKWENLYSLVQAYYLRK